VGAFVFIVLPTLATILIAFTEYDGVAYPSWVGLENFSRLLESPYARIALRNTLIFVLLAVPLRLAGALLAALLLQNPGKAFGFYRMAIYLPTVIPEVAYALIWLWIFNPLYGPLNIALNWLGLPAPAWLVEPATARLAIVIMLAFQIGEGLVIVLTGLQNVPRAYYEAANVDGASVWQSFWRITLPLLTPWLLLLFFRDVIVSLQSTFTPTFTMTYGGPYYATTFAPLFIYEATFDFNDYGLAAAFLVVTYFMLGLLVYAILNLIGGREAVNDA
jgi:multiple sugar transport system permease protein